MESVVRFLRPSWLGLFASRHHTIILSRRHLAPKKCRASDQPKCLELLVSHSPLVRRLESGTAFVITLLYCIST